MLGPPTKANAQMPSIFIEDNEMNNKSVKSQLMVTIVHSPSDTRRSHREVDINMSWCLDPHSNQR
jgi:hypothetical protein